MNFNISELVYSMSAIKKYFNDPTVMRTTHAPHFPLVKYGQKTVTLCPCFVVVVVVIVVSVFVIQLLLNLYFCF